MNRHVATVHEGLEPFNFGICDQSYKQKELSDVSKPKKVYSVLPNSHQGQWIVPIQRLQSGETFKENREEKKDDGKVYSVLPKPRKGQWIVPLRRLTSEEIFKKYQELSPV